MGDADVVVVPGYTAVDYHLNISDPRKLSAAQEIVRPGYACQGNNTLQSYKQIRLSKLTAKKKLVFVDAGILVQQLVATRHNFYVNPAVTWGVLGRAPNPLRQYLSLPAKPSARCSSTAAFESFMEPLHMKRHLASFQGSAASRMQLKHTLDLYNETGFVTFANDGDNHGALLFSSVFILFLMSDAEVGNLFNDAVCSGGIPVILGTSRWLPPFDPIAPFAKYGIWLPSYARLSRPLRGVSEVRRTEFRELARRACTKHFQSMQHVAESFAEFFTTPRLASHSDLVVEDHMSNHANVTLHNGWSYAISERDRLCQRPASSTRWQPIVFRERPLLRDFVIHGEAVYAVDGGFLLKQLLQDLSPGRWALASRALSVVSIAIEGDAIYGIGYDDIVYHQSLRSMKVDSDWGKASLQECKQLLLSSDVANGLSFQKRLSQLIGTA